MVGLPQKEEMTSVPSQVTNNSTPDQSCDGVLLPQAPTQNRTWLG